MGDKVQFIAQIGNTTNAKDGGYKVVFEIPEKYKLSAQALLGLKDSVVSVAAVVVSEDEINRTEL